MKIITYFNNFVQVCILQWLNSDASVTLATFPVIFAIESKGKTNFFILRFSARFSLLYWFFKCQLIYFFFLVLQVSNKNIYFTKTFVMISIVQLAPFETEEKESDS